MGGPVDAPIVRFTADIVVWTKNVEIAPANTFDQHVDDLRTVTRA